MYFFKIIFFPKHTVCKLKKTEELNFIDDELDINKCPVHTYSEIFVSEIFLCGYT